MIKMATAITHEIDDPKAAVDDLLQQLDCENTLLTHSVGVASCYLEYLETGVLSAICDALPFQVVGCTTLGCGNERETGSTAFCISVLTSDDAQFSTVYTDPLSGHYGPLISDAYAKGKAALPQEPKLILAFLPLILQVGSERILDEITRVTGGVPTFGTIACDHNLGFQNAFTFADGACGHNRLAMVLISGEVNARFVVAALSNDKVQKQHAIITKSEGNVIHEVNNIPILEYLDSLGLTRDNGLEGTTSIPFMVSYNDGTQPVARAIYLTQSDGSVSCGGLMPMGATLSIGSIDYDDVLATAEKTMEDIVAHGRANGILMYPCLGRNLVLGANLTAELDKISEVVGGTIPYQVCYAGGEICPVYIDEHASVNRFHNFSLVACVF